MSAMRIKSSSSQQVSVNETYFRAFFGTQFISTNSSASPDFFGNAENPHIPMMKRFEVSPLVRRMGCEFPIVHAGEHPIFHLPNQECQTFSPGVSPTNLFGKTPDQQLTAMSRELRLGVPRESGMPRSGREWRRNATRMENQELSRESGMLHESGMSPIFRSVTHWGQVWHPCPNICFQKTDQSSW